MLSTSDQQEIQRQILRTLIQFGLLPDPTTGMFQRPPDQHALLNLLNNQVNQLMHNGGHSSDAKQGEPIIPLSTLEMDITGVSSLIFQLGRVTEELATLMNILMRNRERLLSEHGGNEDGNLGRSVVEI